MNEAAQTTPCRNGTNRTRDCAPCMADVRWLLHCTASCSANLVHPTRTPHHSQHQPAPLAGRSPWPTDHNSAHAAVKIEIHHNQRAIALPPRYMRTATSSAADPHTAALKHKIEARGAVLRLPPGPEQDSHQHKASALPDFTATNCSSPAAATAARTPAANAAPPAAVASRQQLLTPWWRARPRLRLRA
jgi:hypothetical protein